MKNVAANDKLKKMVKDQQEAEKKKVTLKTGDGGALISYSSIAQIQLYYQKQICAENYVLEQKLCESVPFCVCV